MLIRERAAHPAIPRLISNKFFFNFKKDSACLMRCDSYRSQQAIKVYLRTRKYTARLFLFKQSACSQRM